MNATRLVTYAQVRAEISGFLQAGKKWNSSPFGAVGPAAPAQGFGDTSAPMDVDAVYRSGGQAAKDVICHYCGKKGHMKKECWSYTAARQSQGQSTYKGKGEKGKSEKGKSEKGKNEKGKNEKGKSEKGKGSKNQWDSKGKSKGGKVAAVTTEGEGAAKPEEGAEWTAYEGQWAAEGQWTTGGTYEDQWVYVVEKADQSTMGPLKCTTWMIDSGSAVNLIPAEGCDGVEPDSSFTLRSATGAPIAHYGHRTVRIVIDGAFVADVRCVVACVRQPILSVSMLMEAGHTVWFDSSGGHIDFASGLKTRLLNQRGVYYLAGCTSVNNTDHTCVNTTTLEDQGAHMDVD
eukprot:4318337-Amphidinium_carterae.1